MTADDIIAWRDLLDQVMIELARTGCGQPRQEHEACRAGEDVRDVLIVDDDRVLATMLATRLGRDGLATRVATSLAEARAAIDERLPDGLVTDVVLPDGTGYSLVEELRATPAAQNTVIVVISVRSAFVDQVEAIHSGADAHFEKPIDWDALSRWLGLRLDARRERSARVLSVEDDPAQAAFLRMVLESAGYEVCVCADPLVFPHDLSSFQPDLVLMDVSLPGASGYDLVRYIRQEEKHATLPVLMLTAEAREEARVRAASAGADEFLRKPVSPSLLVASVAARTERARLLRSLLERDGLTRLLTHTAFSGRARAAFARGRRHPETATAWVMIDIDHFKAINDRYGHPVGDHVLVGLAQLLRRHLRQSDSVGRYGGEEFALLLHDLGAGDAGRLVERLREEFAATSFRGPDGSTFHATFSAGIAVLDHRAIDVDTWRRLADDALYAAKRAGRNRVAFAAGPALHALAGRN